MNDIRVDIASDADTVVARQHGRAAALRLGLSRSDATFVATAISEIARNITMHAGKGVITISDIRQGDRQGLLVVARDEGPGIADLASVLRDDFVSDAGLGIGLLGARRLMDEVEITSEPGSGTTVTMRKWCAGEAFGVRILEESVDPGGIGQLG